MGDVCSGGTGGSQEDAEADGLSPRRRREKRSAVTAGLDWVGGGVKKLFCMASASSARKECRLEVFGEGMLGDKSPI